MSVRDRRNSFLIRIWWEETAPNQEDCWRGWVQHVHTGESSYVQEWETLQRFIKRWTGHLSGPPTADE